MNVGEINKIECNLHCLHTLDEAYKRIIDELTDYFSIKKINFLIVIHGYNRGIYFRESVRSDRFQRKMEQLGYKIKRYEKLEKKEGIREINEGVTAFYIDNIQNPSRKPFLQQSDTEEPEVAKPKEPKKEKRTAEEETPTKTGINTKKTLAGKTTLAKHPDDTEKRKDPHPPVAEKPSPPIIS